MILWNLVGMKSLNVFKKMLNGQPRENISLFVENVADECELENNEESAYKRKKVLKANTNME